MGLMIPSAVSKSLLEQPELAKELRLNGGSQVVVLTRERWITGPDFLSVLDGHGFMRHISYRNITSIRYLRPNGRRARRRR